MQCPKDLDAPDYALTEDVHFPWIDSQHVDPAVTGLTDRGERKVLENFGQYARKIKPLMIGPRCLSRSLTYKALKRGYENYLKDQRTEKSGRLMCYFGNAQGPVPLQKDELIDFDNEQNIMGYFGSMLAHPNEKRARAAAVIGKMDNCDARVISSANADSKGGQDESKVIPLPEFCAHVAKFQYNLNISGYRRSIPNRFIESFMVGTAIVTDKLAVKWYRPFDKCEVVESIPMGYLPMDQVDWERFEKDLAQLPETEPQQIIKNFNEKWRPDVVARYIVDTVREA